jgi:hypothetical protein
VQAVDFINGFLSVYLSDRRTANRPGIPIHRCPAAVLQRVAVAVLKPVCRICSGGSIYQHCYSFCYRFLSFGGKYASVLLSIYDEYYHLLLMCSDSVDTAPAFNLSALTMPLII